MALFRLKRTDVNPESYDIYQGERRIGYMQLCQGTFEVIANGSVWKAWPRGVSAFEPEERYRFLRLACESLITRCDLFEVD